MNFENTQIFYVVVIRNKVYYILKEAAF